MKRSRWINFLGGMNLVYTLGILIMIGIIFLLFNTVSFLFEPLVIIISSIIMPMVISLLLYYLFNPLIDFLEDKGMKRIISVSLLYVVVLALLGILIGTLIPLLRDQFISLADNFPFFIDSITNTVTQWLNGLPYGQDVQTYIEQGENFVGQIPQNITEYLNNGLSSVSTVVSSVTNVVITLVTFPIILFFLLKDEKKISKGALAAVPPKWREEIIRVFTEINSQVGAYIKGQLIIATSIGVMMFIGFQIIGLEYPGILALIAGFTSVIPYIGPTLAFIPAVVVALITSWFMVLKLIIVWMVVQFIDGNLIEPNVMGRQLHIHPLTIIVVLLVIGDLLGIFGLIFGVPIYAILKVIVVELFQKFKKRYNKYYGDVSGEYEVRTVEEAVRGDHQMDDQMKETVKESKENRREENKKIKEKGQNDHEKQDKEDDLA